jgi:hypothetical protein
MRRPPCNGPASGRSAQPRGQLRHGGDGHTVAIAYKDGSIATYETDPGAWIEHACAVAGRNLTEDEWRDAFGDRPYRETCPAAAG